MLKEVMIFALQGEKSRDSVWAAPVALFLFLA
jgi:hypothetical protein